MSEPQITPHEAPDPHEPSSAYEGRHPSVREYVRVGLILVLLTGLEVVISYSSLPHTLLIALLFIFSGIKFTLVVLWFMHLKFDDRRYARFFTMGLAGAITLYLIVLISFRVFLRLS